MTAIELANPVAGLRSRRNPMYRSWYAMVQRCTNPENKSYSAYNGRGTKVCDRWLSFENFCADMGERPVGMTLDRINNDGHYEPGNCRWATPAEQARNTRQSLATHCQRGHEITPENTAGWKPGRRECKEACDRERKRRRWREKAEREGRTVQAAPAERTHCPQGHEYSPENTYVDIKGNRHCRPCMRDRARARRARIRGTS